MHAQADHVTPYDRLAWSDLEVEELLASGRRRDELIAYFGADEYRELARLTRAARRAPLDRGMRVFVVPGIMGSHLGLRRRGLLPNDILWIDPIDITIGRLTALRLPSTARIVPLGAVLFTYLRLKLHLRAAGFDAVLHAYDWRLGIEDLGRQLVKRLREQSAPRIALVAHSMGGLVGRAALALRGLPAVERFVMLGTPNFGSFAPVQALRGTYSVVRKIARLDLRHSAEDLAGYVFSTFPSLYELLPSRGRVDSPDLLDPRAWPTRGPSPRAELLAAARDLEQKLAAADERFHVVVGVDQETVTSVTRERDDFVYTVTRFGDGTVPAACAVLPGASHYYTPVAHSELTRDPKVAAAVVDLLRDGATRRLPTRATPARSGTARISDAELRRRQASKIDWTGLEPEQRRIYLATLNEPPKLRLQPDVVVPARRARSRMATRTRARVGLAIRIEKADIANVRADALVAGVFQDVRPAGALAAIDRHLGGVVAEFTARRMLPREAGALLPVPASGRLAHADHVLLVGLGRFDQLSERTIELAAENVARFCARTGIGRIGTVLWGAGAGMPMASSLTAQLRGYVRGVGEADAEGTIRSITFCVRGAAGLTRLSKAARALLAGVRLPERRVTLYAAGARDRRAGRAEAQTPPSPAPSSAYLLVSEERAADGVGIRTALLTAGRQAAVITEVQPVAGNELAQHLRKLGGEGVTFARLTGFGERLAGLTLHPTIREALDSSRGDALVVVHDTPTSRVPWETLCLKGRFPAAESGLSRRYAAEQLDAAKFSEARRERRELCVLLVADPTNDLPGARLERDRILALLRNRADIRVVLIEGRAATHARLRAEFVSGAYDLLHYAGHAAFEADDPARSGIRCSDRVLSGADLHALEQLPALVVFNACESGRIRRARAAPRTRVEAAGQLRAGAGLAEVFLRNGVANYVGTWWPVADASALAFAEALYAGLLRGASIGDAVVAGRAAVRKLRSIDWADYMHYGDPDFRLKKPPSA